ncbi:DUF2513 domain-containing protein [Bifidobacterium platyrrhinorum]|nr:DUF2513 domain-containing protein [Bifidobacterium platyrrhinorum]
MMRDMDLIRSLLFDAENDGGSTARDFTGYSRGQVVSHLLWLQEAGLIDVSVGMNTFTAPLTDGNAVEIEDGRSFYSALTWDGCELLDAIRSDALWRALKRRLGENDMPSVSFNLIRFLADKMARDKLGV